MNFLTETMLKQLGKAFVSSRLGIQREKGNLLIEGYRRYKARCEGLEDALMYARSCIKLHKMDRKRERRAVERLLGLRRA